MLVLVHQEGAYEARSIVFLGGVGVGDGDGVCVGV